MLKSCAPFSDSFVYSKRRGGEKYGKKEFIVEKTEWALGFADIVLYGICETLGGSGHMNQECFQRVSLVLSELGLTINYAGFNYVAYAVSLCMQEPDRLLLVTKWLYPDVARRYHTSSACVERNIRTICKLSWERNPALVREMARHPLTEKPSNTELIAILTTYLSAENDPDAEQGHQLSMPLKENW